MLTPAIRAICLALTLLVSRVCADDEDRTISADDLALLAHRLNGRSNLHCSGFLSNTGSLPSHESDGRVRRGPLGRRRKIAGTESQARPPPEGRHGRIGSMPKRPSQ